VPESLRSDCIRDRLAMPFGFIPDSAFGFAESTATEKRPLSS
jgi:hypothetical protein